MPRAAPACGGLVALAPTVSGIQPITGQISPVVEPRPLGPVAGTQPLPAVAGHVLEPIRHRLEPQPLPAGHRQDITAATLLNTAAQRIIRPIDAVAGHPPAWA